MPGLVRTQRVHPPLRIWRQAEPILSFRESRCDPHARPLPGFRATTIDLPWVALPFAEEDTAAFPAQTNDRERIPDWPSCRPEPPQGLRQIASVHGSEEGLVTGLVESRSKWSPPLEHHGALGEIRHLVEHGRAQLLVTLVDVGPNLELAAARHRAISFASACSTKRQRAFAIRICSIVRHSTSRRRGLATTYARHFARDTATLSRLREKRKSRLRGRSSPLEVAIEKKTTAASCPWNLSTVPIRAPSGSVSASSATWSLYGATTRTSPSASGRVTPEIGRA